MAHGDMVMLPIELVSASDPFLLRARETFNIVKFKTEETRGLGQSTASTWTGASDKSVIKNYLHVFILPPGGDKQSSNSK